MERLEEGRQKRLVGERQREEEGRVVVGSQIIEEAMQALPVRDESKLLLELQQGRRGKLAKGRGKQRALR